MNHRYARLPLLTLLALALAACSGPTPAASAVLAPTATSLPPTATVTVSPPPPIPTATASPTPELYHPPVERFLPSAKELGGDYAARDNILLNNLSILAELPVPRENVGAASFAYNGSGSITAPQNGLYNAQVFVVIAAPDEASARMFYAFSQGGSYRSQAFLVIMPGAVHEQMGAIHEVAAGKSTCDEITISLVNEDIYGALRSGSIPTDDPLMKSVGGFSAERLAELPPQLYLFAGCRARNVLVLYWGSAPNNYDGKNAPIPDEVLAQQVEERLRLVLSKLN